MSCKPMTAEEERAWILENAERRVDEAADLVAVIVALGAPRLHGWVMGRYVVEPREDGKRILRDLESGAEQVV